MLSEILMNPSWTHWQVDYLLILQSFRESTNGFLNPLFEFITTLGAIVFPVIFMAGYYWCINTKDGLYMLLTNGFGNLTYQAIKITACVKRPWLLDSRINPVGNAVDMARGYSFPSGHTTIATTVWGSFAFVKRHNKLVRNLLILLILIVGFSRNYLCVHLPQDVIAGILVGLFMIILMDKLLNFAYKSKKNEIIFVILGNLFALLVMYYANLKHIQAVQLYGKNVSQEITVWNVGYLMGILNGAFLCKNFVKYDAKKGNWILKVAKFIIGVLGLMMFYMVTGDMLVEHLGQDLGDFINFFSLGLFITLVYPFILKIIER